MSGNNDGKIPPPEPSPLGVLTGAAPAGAASSSDKVSAQRLAIDHAEDEILRILNVRSLGERIDQVEKSVTELSKKLAAVQAGSARLPQIEQLIVAHDQRLAQLGKHRHDDQGECVVRLG